MSLQAKKTLTKIMTAVFAVLLTIGTALIVYLNSPIHPANISDEVIIEKGTEYEVKLKGISGYNETGFCLVTDGFYFSKEKLFVYTDEEGFAKTTDRDEGGAYLLGGYNSADVLYENYNFCGEQYKNRQELEAFFEAPDRIYDFDINNLSYYISDIINYKKQFTGSATLKIYKGRCVITSVSVGDAKVLEIK